MAASSYFTSQKHNYSQGTNWSATRVLMGDGTWVDKANPIYVANTVFVSKLGDDATGAVQRFDLPFLTIAAARTATLAYWTGGTAPSATNRIRIVVQSGRYLEKIVLANFVDWDLTNSIIELQAGAFYTIDDDNVACDSIIYGNPQIIRSTSGTGGCIRTQNAGTNLRIYADSITSSIGGVSGTIYCVNGTQYIKVVNNIVVTGVVQIPITCDNGNQTVEALSISGNSGVRTITCNGGNQIVTAYNGTWTPTQDVFYCNGGNQTIYSDGTTSGLGDAAIFVGGTQTIYGNLVGARYGASSFGGGTQTIYGNISSIAGSTNVVLCSAGATQIINNSRISAPANVSCLKQQSGGVSIINNCTLLTSGTGKSIADGSTVILNTPCGGNKALGTAITKGCSLTISSDIQ